jgi:predicted RNA-binding protein with TRAM domain
MGIENYEVEEGLEYSVKVDAKGARGEGIGKVGNFVIFVKNAKTRIGNIYKVKVTKVHRTFAYAELKDPKQYFVGNGSLIDFG